VCTASIIKPVTKPHAKNQVEMSKLVGQSGILAGRIGKGVRKESKEGSQLGRWQTPAGKIGKTWRKRGNEMVLLSPLVTIKMV
jgi:hypothetical protein